ncbi:hypothetical protein [Caldimonas tepidiphila]|uniref:hypothetical protein n=1 Tax=Caldimonas tepidiphila TaxID=2315841 RepID=UPI001300AA5B|nr:hypothetical protein [Caldimonas tepidiphila]
MTADEPPGPQDGAARLLERLADALARSPSMRRIGPVRAATELLSGRLAARERRHGLVRVCRECGHRGGP